MKKTWLYILVVVLILNLGMAGVVAASSPADQPEQQSTGTPTIRIVQPVENGIVPIGDVPVEVSASAVPANGGYQWQFYLDGLPAGTAAANIISYTMEITVSGPHSIKAALTNAQARELGSAEVQVTAAPRTPDIAFNQSEMGPVMAVLTLGILLLIIFSLRLTRRPRS